MFNKIIGKEEYIICKACKAKRNIKVEECPVCKWGYKVRAKKRLFKKDLIKYYHEDRLKLDDIRQIYGFPQTKQIYDALKRFKIPKRKLKCQIKQTTSSSKH